MKIANRIHLIASGLLGCSLTHDGDCNAYAIDGGSEFALIDSGCGIETERLIENMKVDGICLNSVRLLLLTHCHLDHSGGANLLWNRLGLEVAASDVAARALKAGDEEAISLGAAKRAGIYPANARFEACPVARVLRKGDELVVGDCTIRVLETPGHSRDMLSFLLSHGNRRDLFCGDIVFHGGRILLQDVADCELAAYSRTLRRLAKLSIDGLYPGHLTWSEHRGQYHLGKTKEFLNQLLFPPNLV